MHILIDDASATTKRMRGRGSSQSRSAPSAGQIAVSCRRQKNGAGQEWACANLDIADQPEHHAAILDALGIALLNRGCLAEGAKLVEQALRIRRRKFGDDHPMTARSYNSYARLLRERGELADAEKTADLAVQINRRAFGNDGLPVAYSLYELGVVHLNQGRFAEAESAAAKGLRILQKLKIDAADPYTTRLMDVRGRAEAAREAFKEATETFQMLLQLDRAQVGPQHPKFATHLANFAGVKEALGQYKQAESDFLKAIDVYANRLKLKRHPNLIDIYANLGSLYLVRQANAADMREAGRWLREALRLNLEVRGPSHLLVANDYANLGRLSYAAENRREALRHFFAALKIYERNIRRGSIPANYIFVAEVLTWICRLLLEGGTEAEAARAEPLLTQAQSIWKLHGAAGKLGESVARACMGRALYLQNKEPARARKLLMGGYDALKDSLEPEHDMTVQVRAWLDELEPRSAIAA